MFQILTEWAYIYIFFSRRKFNGVLCNHETQSGHCDMKRRLKNILLRCILRHILFRYLMHIALVKLRAWRYGRKKMSICLKSNFNFTFTIIVKFKYSYYPILRMKILDCSRTHTKYIFRFIRAAHACIVFNPFTRNYRAVLAFSIFVIIQ